MRVAYVCADPGIPVFGTTGGSVHIQEMVRAWRHAGAAVTVYCVRQGIHRPADLAGLDVVEVPLAPAHGQERESANADAAVQLSRRVLRDGCDLVYERYSLFSTALHTIVHGLNVPGVLEVNAPLIEEQQQHRQLWDLPGAENALRRNAGAADVVACVSDPVVRWVRDRVPRAKVLLTPNGVNLDRITPRLAGQRSARNLIVAFVGTLKPWHGVPMLLEAVALANKRPGGGCPWSIRIIGDGPMRPELETMARELNVPTEFQGAVPPEAVPGLLGTCDAAVAPYPASEAGKDDYFSPLKVYEYMAAAMPIIATSAGQISSILEDGRTGMIIPPGDPAALADALLVLAVDPALRLRLGTSARAEAVRRFSWDGVLSRITAALPAAGKVAVP